MGSFVRRNEGNDSYLMNQPMTVTGSYSHSGGHEFNTAGSGPYHLPQHSFNTYGSQFGPSYGQQSGLSAGMQHLQYPSDHTIPSMTTSEELRLHHSSSQYMPEPRYLPTRYLPLREALSETEIEDQESHNEATTLSEAVVPPLDGFPDVKEFDQLMQSYVDELSVKKQDKALIHAKRARNIKNVLMEPKDTAIESAQFRFWVKKMFKLQSTNGMGTTDCRKMICHEGKPVAIREKLFKILTQAHKQCQHGGRDKTSAQVRLRRGGSRLTPPSSRRSSPRLDRVSRSPKLPSPPLSRRESSFGGQVSLDRAHSDYFGQLHGHHGWIDGHQNVQARSTLGSGVRSSHGPMGSLTHSITGTLDHFPDLSVSGSQLSYTGGYVPMYGPPPQREY
ncbi:hypothetical protein N7466_004194 [Penicillium verhagenii]|uniref:uncharacterized protein n=1 Tax=Penicillium verhagenii TaxID=1562060 RepID=UPI0025456901|nr:uncharacterized protein N7466_004194 [Penicillium verhagenii]KAJ5934647.1 hypothetical protein N7466_004194 [Penicillium verhagenii]